MTTKIQLILLLSLALLPGLLTSCNKDNVDEVISDGEFPIDTVLCMLNFQLIFDDSTASISVTSLNGGTAPYSYAWNTGDNSSVIMVSASGSYSVTVTDADGCTATDSFIVVSPDPCEDFMVTINLEQDSLNGVDYLNAVLSSGMPPYVFVWNTADSLQLIDVTGSTGEFSVTVTDANGCTAEDNYLL
jgi:SprB repeat